LERIVFVYNKIDREDIDKKTMQEIIDKIKNFLKEYNITKPKIFPISAEYAKLAQLKELSRKKKIDLQNYQDNFHPVLEENYKGYELLEHSPLTASQKETLRKRIDNSEV